MKEYMKPELEVITLVAEEVVTDDDIIEGDVGLSGLPEGW
jgi:hypothetical protein